MCIRLFCVTKYLPAVQLDTIKPDLESNVDVSVNNTWFVSTDVEVEYEGVSIDVVWIWYEVVEVVKVEVGWLVGGGVEVEVIEVDVVEVEVVEVDVVEVEVVEVVKVEVEVVEAEVVVIVVISVVWICEVVK